MFIKQQLLFMGCLTPISIAHYVNNKFITRSFLLHFSTYHHFKNGNKKYKVWVKIFQIFILDSWKYTISYISFLIIYTERKWEWQFKLRGFLFSFFRQKSCRNITSPFLLRHITSRHLSSSSYTTTIHKEISPTYLGQDKTLQKIETDSSSNSFFRGDHARKRAWKPRETQYFKNAII